jgi:ABC-type Fe3+/spermidine/putrescine transport system ATPase subunit
MTPLLSLKHVAKRLGSHPAVDDVTFDVAHGEAIAILGPSGSGKTTLLRLIAGLETPDHGEISLDGIRVAADGRSIIAPHERRIGFVFQDLALWPHMTVQQQLEFVLGSLTVPRSGWPARIKDALTLVRIDHLASRYPHQLSGGEQQRAALARTLVAEPRLILLDEPLASLDPELRAHLRQELAALQRSLDVTSVYVTHDTDDARALADRILEMRAGRIVGDVATRRAMS